MENKKLYRSQSERMFAGVCGGLGQFIGMDPTVVRVIFALLAVFGGSGLLIYLILMLIVPLEPTGGPADQPGDEAQG